MRYQPIENYAMIGNMHTAALVSIEGSIDWFCYPHFDSPSIFGKLLDADKGGHFEIKATNKKGKKKQVYWPDTNVLVTRFLSEDGIAEVVDYMPVGIKRGKYGYHQLIRRVTAIHGSVEMHISCKPAFNYARDKHTTKIVQNGARFDSKNLSLGLATNIKLQEKNGEASTNFTLNEGETQSFVLHHIGEEIQDVITLSNSKAEELFRDTVEYWHKWLSKCTYKGRWREQVHRSALLLKLLTFNPTGAIVASPTASLPEGIGGQRNWDYRYTWIRDAAFTVYALMRIGFTEEAERFVNWLGQRCHELGPSGSSLSTMYTIEGNEVPQETILEHLEGYEGSTPVRIGNAASKQLQLDIYGELMDSVYLYNKYGSPISYDLWVELRKLANWVVKNWDQKDEGIWEIRGEKQHFVYSKVMCWVALDRAQRLAYKRSLPAERESWIKERDKIYETIMEKGWNEERKAFTQSFGSDYLDAANLIMPLVFFMSPSDPKMISTLEAIMKSPKKEGLLTNSFVYRYDVRGEIDGIAGEEGTFNICTFWLVEALTRAGATTGNKKHLEDARIIFEQMLGFANHQGLFSEQIGMNGEALGNFPQAFTHLALISAAFNLDKALGSGN